MIAALLFCLLAMLCDAASSYLCRNGQEVGPVGHWLGGWGRLGFQLLIAAGLQRLDSSGGLWLLGSFSLLATVWNLNQKYHFTSLL